MKKVLIIFYILFGMLFLSSCFLDNNKKEEKEPDKYSVTFVFDNGNENLVKYYDYEDTIEYPENPSKEGYIFQSWQSNLFSGPIRPTTMPKNNFKITANIY